MLERRDFLLAERGADRDREMASGIQHNAAALVARLQATGTSGVRAALGGSPVAYGSLRAAQCILTRRDFDVNSLTRRGTKSRSGHTGMLNTNRHQQQSQHPCWISQLYPGIYNTHPPQR